MQRTCAHSRPPLARPARPPLPARPRCLRCAPPRVDHLVTNPVVRLHVLDPASGQYLRNLMVPGVVLSGAAQAQVRGRAYA